MGNIEIKTVMHDGTRNFFGGRNLIQDSTSPVFTLDVYSAPAYVGQARAGLTVLLPGAIAEEAMVDYTWLET